MTHYYFRSAQERKKGNTRCDLEVPTTNPGAHLKRYVTRRHTPPAEPAGLPPVGRGHTKQMGSPSVPLSSSKESLSKDYWKSFSSTMIFPQQDTGELIDRCAC